MSKIKVGISVGDINGIGLEVILKTFSNESMLSFCTPVLYCSSKVVSYHKNVIGKQDVVFQNQKNAQRLNSQKLNVVNCWQENTDITLGEINETGGKFAIKSLESACEDLKKKLIDVLVTAPIHKHAMELAGFPYKGHTEYLGNTFDGSDPLMFMVSPDIKVALVTNHLPLKEVSQKITKDLILKKLKQLNHSLKMDFGIERPLIAVLGLNPHAGDEGSIGKEEKEIIRPAIVEAKKQGMMCMGPFPADGFFGSSTFKKYHAVLAMYHDQGLIPFKSLSFGNGTNFTAGLPIIRTSPDHGTGFDIVGKNMADPSSFRTAIFAALDIFRQRSQFIEDHENPMRKRKTTSEKINDKNEAAELPRE